MLSMRCTVSDLPSLNPNPNPNVNVKPQFDPIMFQLAHLQPIAIDPTTVQFFALAGVPPPFPFLNLNPAPVPVPVHNPNPNHAITHVNANTYENRTPPKDVPRDVSSISPVSSLSESDTENVFSSSSSDSNSDYSQGSESPSPIGRGTSGIENDQARSSSPSPSPVREVSVNPFVDVERDSGNLMYSPVKRSFGSASASRSGSGSGSGGDGDGSFSSVSLSKSSEIDSFLKKARTNIFATCQPDSARSETQTQTQAGAGYHISLPSSVSSSHSPTNSPSSANNAISDSDKGRIPKYRGSPPRALRIDPFVMYEHFIGKDGKVVAVDGNEVQDLWGSDDEDEDEIDDEELGYPDEVDDDDEEKEVDELADDIDIDDEGTFYLISSNVYSYLAE